jgi:predicted N-acetyltransferase YhbS
MVDIVELKEISAEKRAAIEQHLSDHAIAAGRPWDPEKFAFTVEDKGEVLGGITGEIVYGWMYVETLAVAESLRGTGLGQKLMSRAETLARARNCRGLWLDTLSFQAPDYYPKLGFEEMGLLPDCDQGDTWHFFRKILT